GGNFFGDRLIDGLIDVCKNADFDQIGDDFEWLLLELLSQLTHDNRRLDGDDLRVGGQSNLGLDRFGGFATGFLLAGEPAGAALSAGSGDASNTADVAAF